MCVCRFEQLERYALDHADAQQHHEQGSLGRHRPRPLDLRHILKAFVQDSQLSSGYFFADVKNMLALAKLLRHIEAHMGLSDMYTCCISPAGADDGPVVQVGVRSNLLLVIRYCFVMCVLSNDGKLHTTGCRSLQLPSLDLELM